MRRACVAFALVFVVVAALGVDARAAQRYALVIGSNQGDPDEARLRYAERDAQRVGDVLTRLGSVDPSDLVLLLGPEPALLERALHALRDDVMAAAARGERPIVLVYFSGHADGSAVHLRGGRFPFAALKSMVAEAKAELSVFLVDACRSGGIVRARGARHDRPIEIRADDSLASAGLAIITSSAEGEDAQESDRLGGGIFTHHLVTGLLGAADASGDQRVTLSEAFLYAYVQTLASTTDTPTLQHPTYAFQLQGTRELVVTHLEADTGLGRVHLTEAGHYVLLERFGGRDVAAELDARAGTSILLTPGPYLVRLRGTSAVYETELRIQGGATARIASADLQQVAYRHATRKGYGQATRRVFSLGADFEIDGPILPDTGIAYGAAVTGQLDFASVALRARVRFAMSGASNGTLDLRQTFVGADLGIYSLFDLGTHGFGFGLRGGFDVVWQDFDARGHAPSRQIVLGRVGPVLRVELALGPSVALQLDAGAEVYLFAIADETGHTSLTSRIVPFGALGFGVQWP